MAAQLEELRQAREWAPGFLRPATHFQNRAK